MASSGTNGLWDLLYQLRVKREPPMRSLWDAVKSGDVELARTFIEKGHDPNAPVIGGSALEVAAGAGDLAMIRMLLDAGAQPGDGGGIGGPLCKAVSASGGDSADRAGVVNALMAAGPADTDVRLAFGALAFSGDGSAAGELVDAALEHGYDAGRLEAARTEAAAKADERGHEAMARFLRAESEDPGPVAGTIDAGLSELLGGVDINDPEAMMAFLGVGGGDGDGDGDDEDPMPPIATGEARGEVERDLCARLSAGEFADALDEANDEGDTPAQFAAEHGLAGVLQALVDAGVKVTGKRSARFLGTAAGRGHLECVQSLLDAGAEADAVGDAVYTPLIRAAEDGHVEIVRALLAAGANPRFRTEAGETAMQRAAGLEVAAIRVLLREHAASFPSETAKGLKKKGKAKPCDAKAGIGPFLDYMLAGHPEWVLTAVRAPIDAVSTELAAVWEVRERMADVAGRAVPEGDGVFVLQLDGHAWTLVPIEIGDYRRETAALAEAAVPALASALSTTAIWSYGEDTSASMGVVEFGAGGRSAALTWEGGGELTYEGPGEGPKGGKPRKRFERYFADLGLLVPMMEVATDGFDRQLVVHNVAVRDIARVDYLAL